MYSLSLKSALSGDVMLCTSFHPFDSTREKGSGLDRICATYLWETTEADMNRLLRNTFSLTTVLFQKLKYKYTMHLVVTRPLMQWRVIEQLTLDLTAATQQINSGFGIAAVRSGVRLTN